MFLIQINVANSEFDSQQEDYYFTHQNTQDMCTNHLEKMICLEDSTRISKKSMIAEILKKKEEADKVNNLPDDQDLERVTGLTYKDFGSVEGAVQAYNFAMGFLIQKGDQFAVNCKLFSNLNLTQHLVE